MTPFLRGHSSGGEDPASATRLGYQRQARLLAPKAADEPHPTLLRTPAAQPRGARRLCQGTSPGRSRYAFVPSSVAIQKAAGSPPRREGPVRHGSRAGRVVRQFLLRRGCGPAGVGGTGDGASAPSPYSVRQPRADLVSSPDPPPGTRPGCLGHRGSLVSRARPASQQSVGMLGLRPRTPQAGSRPSDRRVSSQRLAPWAPVRRRLAGRPVAQCLTKRWMSKTSFVCSRW